LDLLENVVSSRKRKLEEDKTQQQTKYIRIGDVERVRVERYIEDSQKIEEKKKIKEKEKEEEIKVRYKEEVIEEKPVYQLSDEDVKKRLIVRGEPITLFGEDPEDRAARLHQLELTEPMEYIEGNELVGSDFIKAIKMENEKCEEDIEEIKKRKLKKKILIFVMKKESQLVL